MNNWQPIETAPKDGKPFLAWDGNRCHYPGVARYVEHGHSGRYQSTLEEIALLVRGCYYSMPLTHWMPLPEPPQ